MEDFRLERSRGIKNDRFWNKVFNHMWCALMTSLPGTNAMALKVVAEQIAIVFLVDPEAERHVGAVSTVGVSPLGEPLVVVLLRLRLLSFLLRARFRPRGAPLAKPPSHAPATPPVLTLAADTPCACADVKSDDDRIMLWFARWQGPGASEYTGWYVGRAEEAGQ